MYDDPGGPADACKVILYFCWSCSAVGQIGQIQGVPKVRLSLNVNQGIVKRLCQWDIRCISTRRRDYRRRVLVHSWSLCTNIYPALQPGHSGCLFLLWFIYWCLVCLNRDTYIEYPYWVTSCNPVTKYIDCCYTPLTWMTAKPTGKCNQNISVYDNVLSKIGGVRNTGNKPSIPILATWQCFNYTRPDHAKHPWNQNPELDLMQGQTGFIWTCSWDTLLL